MAQSLQKCWSPWLVDEESLELWNSLNSKFRTLLNETSSTLSCLFLVSELFFFFFLHRLINTDLNLLFSEINFSCKVRSTYIVTNVLFVKIVLSIPFIHCKLMKLNTTICSVLSLSAWWQQLLGKNFGLQCQNRLMVSDLFAFRKTKSCRQHAIFVLSLTLVT